MTELLPLPKINSKIIDDNASLTDFVSEDKASNILTNMVRHKYFDFLEKLLADNYEKSLSGDVLSCQDIRKCAEYLEFKALRSCMIVNLYRESILKIFAEIRNDTAQKKLNINLSNERICQRKTRRNVQIQTDLKPTIEMNNPPKPMKRKHLRNIRVQTDSADTTNRLSSEYTISLDERLRMFEKKFSGRDAISHSFPTRGIDCYKRFKENRKRRHSSISLESPLSSVDSSIHRSTDRTDSRIDSCTDNEGTQLMIPNVNALSDMLTTPIENVEVPVDDPTDDHVAQEMMALFGEEEDTDIFGEAIICADRHESVQVNSDKLDLNDMATESRNEGENESDPTAELKNSMWPCELHMQRMKLQEVLLKKGFRCSEKIRKKFEELFGPEDDDDDCFAPYSPTIELDEILMSSCKRRIAPWIVKHLKSMSDSIENRYLFKKVAKRIAEKVILEDQYPSEQRIKKAVDDFFKTHKYIGSIDDIT